MSKKSRVLSVRLSLDSLQSVFDFNLLSGRSSSGASSSLAFYIETMTAIQRASGKLPSYEPEELEVLLLSFKSKTNPVSVSTFDDSTQFNIENFNTNLVTPMNSFDTSTDPSLSSKDPSTINSEFEEYSDLIEQKIREIQQAEEDNLLSQILIKGD